MRRTSRPQPVGGGPPGRDRRLGEAFPGTEALTRFEGSWARSAPDVRDYFSVVIPVLEREQRDFERLDTKSPKAIRFPPLLTAIGDLVILYDLVMALLFLPRQAHRRVGREEESPADALGDADTRS